MRNKTYGWLTRIKAVEKEFNAVSFATQRLHQQVLMDPAILPAGLRQRDIASVVDRLDGTYVIRLFAEFETSLRAFLRHVKCREPRLAEALINRVRVRGNIPNDETSRAHTVRDYRNAWFMIVKSRSMPFQFASAKVICAPS